MTTASSRKTILAFALLESATVLAEQEDAMAAAPPPPAPAAPFAPEAAPASSEPLTLDAVLDRLNTIRSGKSFTDPMVYAKMSSWFGAMNGQAQAALNDQLMAISAIVQNQAFDIPQQQQQPAAPAPPAAAPPPATPPPPAA